MTSAYEVLLAAEARRAGRAVRSTTVRHYHLEEGPHLLSLVRTGGERFRPSAVVFQRPGGGVGGRLDATIVFDHQDSAHFVESMNHFAKRFNEVVEGRDPGRFQLIVPNQATVRALGLLGRSLSGVGGRDGLGLPPGTVTSVRKTGRYLSILARYARRPGQAVVVPLATALDSHWSTVMAPFERAELASLEAQINAGEGEDVFEAVRRTRANPPLVGPNMKPEFENDLFEARYAELLDEVEETEDEPSETDAARLYERVLRERLEPVRALLDRAVRRERSELPESRGALLRWERDWSPGGDLRYALDGARVATESGTPYRSRESASVASRFLDRSELAKRRFEAEVAFDDPARFAPLVLAGKASVSTVESVTATPEAGAMTRYELVLSSPDPFVHEEGSSVAYGYGAEHPSFEVESSDVSDAGYTAVLVSRRKTSRPASLPAPGDVLWTMEYDDSDFRPRFPSSAWTHAAPVGAGGAPAEEEPVVTPTADRFRPGPREDLDGDSEEETE